MTSIWPCGTEVKIKRTEYDGIITGVNIRDERITYEVSYFESGSYKSVWFCEYEFTPIEYTIRQRIGFVGEEDK